MEKNKKGQKVTYILLSGNNIETWSQFRDNIINHIQLQTVCITNSSEQTAKIPVLTELTL